VTIKTSPSQLYTYQIGGGQQLSFDLIVDNSGTSDEKLQYLELDFRDKTGKLIFHQFMGGNGTPGAIATLAGRNIPAGGKSSIFNPFQFIPTIDGLASIRVGLYFESGKSTEIIKPIIAFEAQPLMLPIKNMFFVGDGDDYNSHHRRIALTTKKIMDAGIVALTQRHALDLTIVNKAGAFRDTDDRTRENYFAWGERIYAPLQGVIVEINADAIDNRLTKSGQRIQPDNFEPFGNYLIMKLADGTFLEMAHFQEGDLSNLSVGSKIKKGQFLGLIGLSGDTSYPHLHIQRQTGQDLLTSEGLPLSFTCAILARGGNKEQNNVSLMTGDVVKSCDGEANKN